jgi:hypothetical protein
MRKYAHYHGAVTFGESVKGSYSKVENQVPCVLHLHNRVIEKELTLLFTHSIDQLASGKNKANKTHRETTILCQHTCFGNLE